MRARRFSLGAVLSLLAGLGLCPLTLAAWPGAALPGAPSQQPLFRPWGGVADAMPGDRLIRPKGTAAPRLSRWSAARGGDVSVALRGSVHGRPASQRAGARKAEPVTRGHDLGLRFRPDEREPAHADGIPAAGNPGSADSQDLHSQFRPIERKRKRTYEEIEAERRSALPPPPTVPSAGLPAPLPPPYAPPLPGYGAPWPPF